MEYVEQQKGVWKRRHPTGAQPYILVTSINSTVFTKDVSFYESIK